MSRSRKRKLQRLRSRYARLPLAATLLSGAALALADEAPAPPALKEIVVTATKRTETEQSVPLSVQVLGQEKLEALHVNDFNDYTTFLPSVATQSYGQGFGRVFMRGVASGDYPAAAGPLPTVGTYLDEQPITTILGALDVHIYDVERIEALPGPQGTLYGASSEAGTLRIITNKPDPSAFKAGYDIEGNTVTHGNQGYVVQGFANVPLSPIAAIRLVGWDEHDAGYIDNVYGTRTYPGCTDPTVCTRIVQPITTNNAGLARNDYNGVDTAGGRAALRLILGDTWTITPTVTTQQTRYDGITAYDPAVGPLELSHFVPERYFEDWVDAAVTIEGKMHDFDLLYTAGYLNRHDSFSSDYTDYSLAYDHYAGYYGFWTNANGQNIAPAQQDLEKDYYRMASQELRLVSPAKWPLRVTAGLYTQRQTHQYQLQYIIDGLSPQYAVTGWPDTWWLTEQRRINRDYAAYSEASYDILPSLTFTAGIREYRYDNTLFGFYGFSEATNETGYSSLGEIECTQPPGSGGYMGAPCDNLNKRVTGSGSTPKFNLSYKIDAYRMVYATVSEGFRPGGINRVGNQPNYGADYLKNYEVGWKTTWFANRVRFNGALYREDWDNFQFSFIAPNENGIPQIANAAKAIIKGMELALDWAATHALTVSSGLALVDARLAANYCGTLDANGNPVTNCADPQAPAGQQLPVTPKFKGDLTARYTMPLGNSATGYVQSAFVYQSAVWPDLRTYERELLGQQPAYGLLNLAFGANWSNFTAELYVDNVANRLAQTYRYAECAPETCAPIATYVVPKPPRTIGIRFGQQF